MSKISIEGNASGTGTLTIAAPNTNSNFTLTLPTESGTVLTNNGNQAGTFSTLTVNSNNISADNSLGFRNRIINGDMRIDQRNAGASVTPADGAYTLDRWVYLSDQASKCTIEQTISGVSAPSGFTDYLGVTSTAATTITTSQQFSVIQRIEGYNMADFAWGTADAKTVTLSFWVRSSLTGTFGGALRNDAGNYNYPFSYTISSANTWEYKTVTITGATSGTWLTTNGRGMQVVFGLGAGATLSGTAGAWSTSNFWSATGATQVLATNGATWYITGVQLEVGSVATPFERRPYGTELMLCQRYFYKHAEGSGNKAIATGAMYQSTNMYFMVPLRTTMRAVPTGVATSGTNYYAFYRDGIGDQFNSITVMGESTTDVAFCNNTSEISGTAGQAGNVQTANASSSLAFSAEL